LLHEFYAHLSTRLREKAIERSDEMLSVAINKVAVMFDELDAASVPRIAGNRAKMQELQDSLGRPPGAQDLIERSTSACLQVMRRADDEIASITETDALGTLKKKVLLMARDAARWRQDANFYMSNLVAKAVQRADAARRGGL
jgi:hypothetical protein